jgi:hypothetical protein
MNEIQEAQEVTGVSPTEGMVQSLVSHFIEGDNKATYLGYLIAGFSKIEAKRLTGIHDKTLTRWQQGDPDFVEFIAKIPDVRERLSNQLLDIEYTRNFKLVLSKDFKVLYKDATGKPLSEQEGQYLQSIRKFYTAQHLIMLRQLLSGKDESGDAFDFTKSVLEIRLSRETGRARVV